MSIAVCVVSKAPIRSQPSDKAEMVTEILFGESLMTMTVTEKWTFVECHWDGYLGWIDNNQIASIKGYEAEKIVITAGEVLADSNHGTIRLPVGSELFKADDHYFLGHYKFKSNPAFKSGLLPYTRKSLIAKALELLNVPYLWGGRSMYGIDCSGLTQLCFKICGGGIRRDASQQAEMGWNPGELSLAKPGDLAFFGESDDKITHVGILLENEKIIHASSVVRIDRMDKEGIYNEATKSHTHKLRFVKSFF